MGNTGLLVGEVTARGVAITGIVPVVPTGPTKASGDVDKNSLVWGDVTQPEWHVPDSATPPLVGVTAAPVPTPSGYENVAWANPNPSLNPVLVLEHIFAAPPGVTGLVFEIDAMLPPGVGASTVGLAITDVSVGANLVSGVAVLTGEWQTFPTPQLTVVPGTLYRARIYFGTGGASINAQVLIARARVRPTVTTNPLFASDFFRYEVSNTLWNNSRDETMTGQAIPNVTYFKLHSSHAKIVARILGQSIGLELFNVAAGLAFGLGQDAVTLSVNGGVFATATGAADTIDVVQISLPPGDNLVEVLGSSWFGSQPTHQPFINFILTDVLKGIYASATTGVELVPPPYSDERVLLYGDSKLDGFVAGTPAIEGMPVALARVLGKAQLYSESCSGRSLWVDCGGPGGVFSAANTASWVTRAVAARPTKLVVGVSSNDWRDTLWTSVAAFQNALLQFVMQFHAALPECKIFLLSTFLESAAQEATTNGNGELLSVYRTAVHNVATQLAAYATFIDGTTVPGFTPTSGAGGSLDPTGIHPNTLGTQQCVPYIASAIGQPAGAAPGQVTQNTRAAVGADAGQPSDTQVVFTATGSYALPASATVQGLVLEFILNYAASGAAAVTLIRKPGDNINGAGANASLQRPFGICQARAVVGGWVVDPLT